MYAKNFLSVYAGRIPSETLFVLLLLLLLLLNIQIYTKHLQVGTVVASAAAATVCQLQTMCQQCLPACLLYQNMLCECGGGEGGTMTSGTAQRGGRSSQACLLGQVSRRRCCRLTATAEENCSKAKSFPLSHPLCTLSPAQRLCRSLPAAARHP